MSAHRSAPIERVEVITRGARRRWSMTEKWAIVAERLGVQSRSVVVQTQP
jgi:hypothetical protein